MMRLYTSKLEEDELKEMLSKVVPDGVGGYMVELVLMKRK